MKVETRLAMNANNETQLEWLGRSGVEYTRWVLGAQLNIPQEPYDALTQVWAGGSGGIGTSNSPLASVENPVHIGNGTFKWHIIDLERKLNINTANEQLLTRVLTMMQVDAGDMTPIVNSILDWMDPGKHTRVQGAQTEYYQTLEPPYEAKNGPLDDITELQFVKNMTPELYWGLASTNHPPAAVQRKQHQFGFQNQGMAFGAGLVDLFTPISSGRVNVNTTTPEVLEVIAGLDPECAAQITGSREGEDDGSGLTGPFRSVDQVRRAPCVTLEMQRLLQQVCDVRSRTFQVEIHAEVGGSSRDFVAILGRNSPRDVQILSFYWK
jgi:general secretion pathway protein K